MKYGCTPEITSSSLLVISKDNDFSEMSVVHGYPPRVVWIRRGNCTTRAIEDLLRGSYKLIAELAQNEDLENLMLI